MHGVRTKTEIRAMNFDQHMDSRCKDWLSPEKTKKFKTLVDLMAKELGGLMLAYKVIGLTTTTQPNLSYKITEDTARKILNAYKKFKATPLTERANGSI